MPSKHSDDIKKHAIHLVIDGGMSIGDAADKLRIGSRSIYNWINELKKSEASTNDLREFIHLRNELLKVKAERDLLRDLVLKMAANKDEPNEVRFS
ncbi:transposase [Gilvimarinus japonicus]|jgi:transposase-like protein|uniref:Transposase n=1 Tax=Gilvimarinus japonicus TaxID=1796469 RepID=A0ABV7HJB7_9GAMM